MAESSTWSCYEEIKLFGELLIENTLVQPTRLNQKIIMPILFFHSWYIYDVNNNIK